MQCQDYRSVECAANAVDMIVRAILVSPFVLGSTVRTVVASPVGRVAIDTRVVVLVVSVKYAVLGCNIRAIAASNVLQVQSV